MRRWAVLALLAVASAGAQELQCNSSQACLAWTAPTAYTDGSAIAAGTLVQYRAWRADEAGTLQPVSALVAGTELKLTAQPRGSQCYAVTAVVAGVESAPSGLACKVIRFPGPTDGAIEAPTDGAIEDL